MNAFPTAKGVHIQFACVLLMAASLFAQTNPVQNTQDTKDSKAQSPKIPRPNMSDESALQQTAFSQAVADALLRRLAHGMQGHGLPQTVSVFSPALLDSGLDARMEAAFSHYESFHIYYKTLEVTGEGEQKGTIVADFDLESRPHEADLAPRRQHARLRLEVERITSARGNPWRIAAMDPDHFFFEH